MKNEDDTDWKLKRLYIIIILNCLLWILFFKFAFTESNEMLYLMGSITIGVTSTWIFISHLIICRKQFSLLLIICIYCLPSISFSILLPFIPQLNQPSGLASPSNKFFFRAKRGISFWKLQFKNTTHDLTKEFLDMIPSNHRLNWRWDKENNLWIYSRLDKSFYVFSTKRDGTITAKKLDDSMALKPPAGITEN
jgi:hypothetical protein